MNKNKAGIRFKSVEPSRIPVATRTRKTFFIIIIVLAICSSRIYRLRFLEMGDKHIWTSPTLVLPIGRSGF